MAQTKIGDLEEARKTIAEALAVSRSIESGSGINIALVEISKAQFDVGEKNAAFVTARSIEKSSYSANALVYIADAQAKRGDMRGARKTLDEALTMARSVKDASWRYPTLTKIAKLQTKFGNIEAAKKTLEEALAATHAVEELQFRIGGMSHIAHTQIEAGDIAAAIETSKSITITYFQARVAIAVANAQIESGNIETARENLATALEAARSLEVSPHLHRSRMLIDIAEALRKAGVEGEAKKILAEVVSADRMRTEIVYGHGVLVYVAEEQARSGAVAAALATARSIKKQNDRADALTKVAVAMAELD